MKGNPLLRVLLLTISLVVMGTLIASMARQPAVEGPGPDVARPPDSTPTLLTLQLSGPAQSLSLRSLDGKLTVIDTTSPELLTEESVVLPLADDHFTALLSLTWNEPGPQHFLRLVLEPDGRDSRELILHAPDHLEDHAIELDWPTN